MSPTQKGVKVRWTLAQAQSASHAKAQTCLELVDIWIEIADIQPAVCAWVGLGLIRAWTPMPFPRSI